MILGAEKSVILIVTQVVFSLMALASQFAALRSKSPYVELIHAIAWSVEVLISVTSMFLVILFSTTGFATVSFVAGILVLIVGTLLLISQVKKESS